MKINEVIQDLDELDNSFVNSKVNKSKWKQIGRGLTASVWHHYDDPNTVVKLVGGGYSNLDPNDRKATITFAEYCLSSKNKHLPKVLGINIDDNEVLQIRFERLNKINNEKLKTCLFKLAENIQYKRSIVGVVYTLKKILDQTELSGSNNIEDIISTLEGLVRIADRHGYYLDLHPVNWLLRPGTFEIVAADPWVA
jgi:hypothetical protein